MLREEILAELRERGDYYSGQELCRKFHVTRAAVWKVIAGLREEGYSIDARRNRGYLLRSDRDALNASGIASALGEKEFFKEILCFREIDSTNLEARRRAEGGESGNLLLVADSQSSGRGRRGRSWDSPPGSGIWMSMLLHPRIRPENASMLTLLCALAVAEGIGRATGLKAAIKWPNDVVVSGKKVCGILTEMNTDMDEIAYVIPGIGINVNAERFPEELRETATSLRAESGKSVDRVPLIAGILKEFIRLEEAFEQRGDLREVKTRYEELLVNRGREVRVLEPQGEYSGTAEGIDERGELLVRRKDGRLEHVRSGEVSVRGIYGYV